MEAAKVKSPGCAIVGVGASAGGLEAFTELLKHLPADTGFGFVLVQHLDPEHPSALAQLLGRVTTMPVREATNNLRVEANQVYIIPPDTRLGLARGILKLQPRARNRTAPHAIDFFLEALAADQGERAIGMILSGTATDGTLGLEAIKAGGGLTFAQDDSARYDSMSRSAVAAGCVDFVLSPRAIAAELVRIAAHPFAGAKVGGRAPLFTALPAGSRPPAEPDHHAYRRVILLLRNHSGVDFSLYKSTTIQRRIARRTILSGCETLRDYARFLQGNAKELDALYSDTLISVTSFFRNPDAFAALKLRVFPHLLRAAGDGPLRLWVLGCSTGQEAYSLAMAYAEHADGAPRGRKLQIFATDLSDANLDKARQGFYAENLVRDVSPARLQRFFVAEKGGYRVSKALRDIVVFARQNIISDPPFSRVDMISCRNVMIYLESSLQKRIIPTFHYALNPGGFLFLGASESIGSFEHLFSPVDKRQKIFARKAVPTQAYHLPLKQAVGPRPIPGKPTRAPIGQGRISGGAPAAFRHEFDAEREADRLTVSQFAPPGVLINAELQILQFRGATSAYLAPPTGKASFDLLRMAREGLMLPLRAAIAAAEKMNKTVRKESVPFQQEGKTQCVNLEVIPLKNLKERCFLILFEDFARSGRPAEEPASPETAVGARRRRAPGRRNEVSRVSGLERDLSDTRDYLQSVQEHQEVANAELQAAIEEGQSANEELQSLNEEMETSKEELESTNEELTTVNDEMVSRNAELNLLIARRKEVEAALRESEQRLESLVAERTAQLTATNERLKSSVKTTQRGKEEYRVLLSESRIMQEKLRHVTHQVLTAQEEERKVISRELHDEVVQTLIGINVELSALANDRLFGGHKLKKKIARTQQLVEGSVKAVHQFARGLRPAVLDDLGLIPALHAYCKALAAEKKLKIQMTAFAGVEALPATGKTVLFRVAQEALNNVVRHARATRVKVTIAEGRGQISMEIGDNGQSFRVDKAFLAKNPKRLGLVGMKERLEMIGGSLTIKSAPGSGTTVRAAIPFSRVKAKSSRVR